MTKTLERKIWRAIPVEIQDKPYADRMIALSGTFIVDQEGRVKYAIPPPTTSFEKEIYQQFGGLLERHFNPRPEYVFPLIKEFVIDSKEGQAALLLRHQMDFAVGKGFQMKEKIYFSTEGKSLEEIYEEHIWVGPTGFEARFAHGMNAKNIDPMLYLLRGNVFAMDVDLYNLDISEKEISFDKEYGKTKTIPIK